MAESRLVPTNLLSWPRIKDLLPDQKLIAYYLWASRFSNSCGCYEIPFELSAVEMGLSELALVEAIRELERRGLVMFDHATGEVFVLDWYRFHKFSSGAQQSQLRQSLAKIQSDRLKKIVIHKINELHPNLTLVLTVTKPPPRSGGGSANPEDRKPFNLADGVEAVLPILTEFESKIVNIEIGRLPPHLQLLVANDFAVGVKQSEGSSDGIRRPIAWLRAVVRDVLELGVFSPSYSLPLTSGRHKPWFLSASGINAKAADLGLAQNKDESFPAFKDRVLAAAGISPEVYREAAANLRD